MEKWFAWVIKTGKFSAVKHFIEDEVPEVVDIYYPFVEKEKSIYGKIIVKEVPLFAGYIFFKYMDSDKTYYKIKSFPYITTFIGKCSQVDINCIEDIRMRENNQKFISKREFDVGDEVLIVNGQFINFKGIVQKVSRGKYFVEVPIFNRNVIVNCTINDIVSESGDLFEW